MKVMEIIDRGGFGRVEKVDLGNGEIVARKVFDPDPLLLHQSTREKLLKRFRREVQIQSSLQSTVIYPIRDWDLETDEPWFTMPLADRTLTKEIKDSKSTGAIPVQALADTLNALEELHRLGYVHRDLKPENVLLHNGVWKLSDFGLVLPPEGTATKLTGLRSAWGTELYAAPEQRVEFHSVGPAADIYSFGCILHDIYGQEPRVPFAKHTAPGQVGAVIEQCTEPNPDRRFRAVSALRATVLNILSAPANLHPTQSAAEWAEKLSSGALGDRETFVELLRFLKRDAGRDDKYSIYGTMDGDMFQQLHSLDEDLWTSLAEEYCEWVSGAGFEFEYCDVLIHHLERIFSMGSVGVQAAVALAAAEMARSHNRWYVMKRVLMMCGHQLDDHVASRIAVDIRAFGAEPAFRRCVEGISQSYNMYHHFIREAIQKQG